MKYFNLILQFIGLGLFALWLTPFVYTTISSLIFWEEMGEITGQSGAGVYFLLLVMLIIVLFLSAFWCAYLVRQIIRVFTGNNQYNNFWIWYFGFFGGPLILYSILTVRYSNALWG